MGGLSVRKISTLNNSFLMKQAWRLHNNPQLLLAKLYNVRGVLPMATCKIVTLRGNYSWGYRGIRKEENLQVNGCAWKVGSGSRIIAGKDKWVEGRIHVFSSNVRLSEAMFWKVSNFLAPNFTGWDSRKVWNNFEAKDARSILSTELPDSPELGFLYWPHHMSGKFTIKTGYAYLQQLEHDDQLNLHHDFYRLLWSLNLPPK
ncbi:uncharacterized protein [Spinacia oleracea]|uniref:Uncharacterized protein n=1 Tax=Spinacia oleracea TaxID=3562 RepID=A0ABM3RQL1_SPIOL|nr:uncharacterized protein LOC130471672 [Spinacia oleracea]